MNPIFLAILLVVGIGAVAGIGLAVASVVMAVPRDETAEAVETVLPGANCGACGFSGCSGYAAALAKGEASLGLCSPGGQETADRIAELLGMKTDAVEAKTAIVCCMGSHDHTSDKMIYQGQPSCAAANQLFGGVGLCRFGCIGLGDCAAVCDYNAITVCNGVAYVNSKQCKGCAKCVAACPKHLISLLPKKEQTVVRCSNCDKGADTRKVCSVGCIGCMRCVKACEAGAITVSNFLATVDPQKCTNCGKCQTVCPQHCITPFA